MTNKRISVALLVPQLVRSHPAGSVTCAMVEDLCDEIDFTVYGSRIDVDLRNRVKFIDVHIPTCRPFLFGFLVQFFVYGFVVRAKKLFKDYDVIHSIEAVAPYTQVMSMHFCGPAALELMKRRVIVPRGWRWGYYYLVNLWGAATEKFITRNPFLRMLVTVSDGLKEEVIRYDAPRVPVFSIPNYADTDRFGKAQGRREQIRADLGFDSGELIGVITAAGDWERKGLDHLIRAVARVRESPLRIIVLGAGPIQKYENICDSFSIRAKFIFTGYSRDLDRYYAAADFFILPSAYEAWPIVVLEAAAAGLPIVGCATNGIKEFVEDGINGYFIPRDPGGIADVLRQLANERAKLPSMGVNAREKARNYSRQRMSEGYRRLYRSLSGVKSG